MLTVAATILASGGGHDPKDHVLPHALVPILDANLKLPLFSNQAASFWFTNHLLMTLVAAAVTVLVFALVGRRYRTAMAGLPVEQSVPRGFAGLIEGAMDALRTGVVRPVLGADTDRFMPFLWTIFFFILVNNLLGMIPFDPVFRLLFGVSHIGGTATGNVNVTAGLALCAFFAIHVSGVREVFRGLVAGTYGHHHEDEESEDESSSHHAEDRHREGKNEQDRHGRRNGARADAHKQDAPGGVSPSTAVIYAPILYVWNFAPHVFAKTGPRAKPAIGLRVAMVPIFVLLLALELKYLLLMIGQTDTAALIGWWAGAVLGLIGALAAGGLHPLDLADALMWAFLFLLECIGAVVKPFALCMRLFANMIAGHIVLASILLLIPAFKGLTLGYLGVSLPIVLGCTLLSGLELFVAFLQAYIFMFLTTMFISAAIHPEH